MCRVKVTWMRQGCDPGSSAGRTMTAGARGQDGAVRHANSHVKEHTVASGPLVH